MSYLKASVLKIEKSDALCVVSFDFEGSVLKMMSLELPQKITVGVKVRLCIKPTNIAIGKNLQGDLSYSNKLQGKIIEIENGDLLSSITIQTSKNTQLESVITKSSCQAMGLKPKDNITALIKASELSILDIVDG